MRRLIRLSNVYQDVGKEAKVEDWMVGAFHLCFLSFITRQFQNSDKHMLTQTSSTGGGSESHESDLRRACG